MSDELEHLVDAVRQLQRTVRTLSIAFVVLGVVLVAYIVLDVLTPDIYLLAA